ncbi:MULTISPECIES: bifunctional pantoate--beta-alanine ligase/(d)CMP kinase [unclassified Microcoleus]|uniref:bifunctional pantoate--beta-alanine ligase/(d)CMP kinase n=1 Tax=unclassified Microcoleus TaxID=2642155 RepID=UPI001E0D5623|nr:MULTISPECIES: bifunctional pantoate--beta-alanine ligase/(d)CMP kinase [unclassified Microcoleus]TAE09813.1 MAG: bifunctional pantoate--beta-alanine ligase/(d)CMP kinase [Oscillatoriales cyanobacterium]MCC3414889.1 bifunctional pantoate--beta-alanine ligase/(d)CMP kinase [Microcoleus sp. PH2017_02_FOX_O_A]MCC3424308.1 bifunctional pantoate--beta-alanine ligase/(d)CMP kinase [Microcoleus sp. PH2017_01_SCD_O_A]MCC3492414.1 bifunctional pantoate--beta-alanine ligase/(d)CMP kinase [Microcoleus s
MQLFTSIAALRCYLNSQKSAAPHVTVGLVPTMGALHAGHLSLIQRARQDNAIVLVSIFVNPLQFGPTEDFQDYPRNLDRDRLLCEQAGVDAIFAPPATEMFGNPGGDRTATDKTAQTQNQLSSLTQVVPPPAMTSVLCGKSRPGHFQGVATIVTKLLSLVQPTKAYFGQKDAQQLAIIRKLAVDFNLPVEIVACPIVREESGLAMSSRNQYLTTEQKQQACALYRALEQASKTFASGDRTWAAALAAARAEVAGEPEVKLEYAELVDPDTLMPLEVVETAGLLAVAARVGSTRLIDNIILRNRRPIVAIDGPAGAGKSTVTRQAAKALGLFYLDTGAMYRALTWLALKTNTPMSDECAIAELISYSYLEYNLDPASFMLKINGEDITEAIRSLEVTSRVSEMAAIPAVRQFLVDEQRRCGTKGGIVAEGRDIGTNVFPDAELKIYLTASVQERSRRRMLELKDADRANISLAQLEQDIALRDSKDSTRLIAPLRKAADAVEIQTDNLTVDEVIDRIVGLYQERIGPKS